MTTVGTEPCRNRTPWYEGRKTTVEMGNVQNQQEQVLNAAPGQKRRIKERNQK